MDPLSGAARVIAVVQIAGTILQICGKYLNNVKNATQDIQRFQERIAALTLVLESLDKLTRGSNCGRLTATQGLVGNIESSHPYLRF
jgi:fatty acid-binding protein DegV